MFHDARLQGFRIGSQWQITREELEEFIEHTKY